MGVRTFFNESRARVFVVFKYYIFENGLIYLKKIVIYAIFFITNYNLLIYV